MSGEASTELQRLEGEALDLLRRHRLVLSFGPVRGFLTRLSTHLQWSRVLLELAR